MKNKLSSGSVLVFTLVMMFMLLALAMAVMSTTAIERKLGGATGKSVVAFQVADSGSETILNVLRKHSPSELLSVAFSDCSNLTRNASGGSYTVTFLKADGTSVPCGDPISNVYQIKSVGMYSGASRAVQVAVAADYWSLSGTNNIFSTNTGNVGIGTTNPGYKLDVKGTLKVVGTVVTEAGPNYGGYFSVGYGSFTSPGPINYAGYFDAYGGYATNYGIYVNRGMSYLGDNLTVKGDITGMTNNGTNPYVLQRGSDNWLRIYNVTVPSNPVYQDLAVGQFWSNGAQRFDLSEVTPAKEEDKLEQGDVVIIDNESGLQVKKSYKSYDTLVYGIVSSYEQASMVIGGEGPEKVMNDAKKIPVALIGRVSAKVSSENGAIQIGDRLTTSSTPGYLMKCSDALKCAGAVAGKALESFENDKGIIKVLVTLQ